MTPPSSTPCREGNETGVLDADDRRFERQMRSVLGGDIYEALSGRGHTATQIASMTPEQRFDEYCAWHLGDRRWGEDLRATWKRCSFDAD
jgi:hypothetical protein